MKKKLLAGILSFLVVLQMGAVAFADDTIIETVKVTASDDNPTDEQIITADVSVSDEDAVEVTAGSDSKEADAKLDLTGNVSATGNPIAGVDVISIANDGKASSEVAINGDVSTENGCGVFSVAETISTTKEDPATGSTSTQVTVTGDVVSDNNSGVMAVADTANSSTGTAASNVNVNAKDDGSKGNVTGTDGIIIISSGSAYSYVSVNVEGNVTGTDGDGVNTLCTDENSSICVFVCGDVSGTENGISASSENLNDQFATSIIVLGSVSGENGIETKGANVSIDVWGESVKGTDAALVVHGDDIPAISVTKLEVAEGGELIKADTPELTEAVAKSIQYIINADRQVNVSGDDVLYGVFTHEDSILLLKLADGYELSGSGEYADVTNNGDGTYTVKVNRGGDLVFTATVKYVAPAAEPEKYVESFLSGNQTDAEQPTMTVNMKASHLQKVLFEGEELDASDYMIAMESHGLLTFQFAEDFIKNLEAGTYHLVFQGRDGTVSFRLIVNTDGSYKIVY